MFSDDEANLIEKNKQTNKQTKNLIHESDL